MPPETRADQAACQIEVAVTSSEAQTLIEGGGYERHRGIGPGRHYRKARGSGCYHLRVGPHEASLHWDGWDPRRHPLRHILETPPLRRSLAAGVGLSMSMLALLTVRLRTR